jgi:hypothetical protein
LRRGNADVHLDVIASEAKQSIVLLRGGMDCFASLAMTVGRWIASRSLSSGAHSRDPVARNDGLSRIDVANAANREPAASGSFTVSRAFALDLRVSHLPMRAKRSANGGFVSSLRPIIASHDLMIRRGNRCR